jgi:hypothetical protein
MAKQNNTFAILVILVILLVLALSACTKKHALDGADPPVPEEPVTIQQKYEDLIAEDFIADDMIIIPTPEDTIEPDAFLTGDYITTENVNLREGPSTDTTRFTTVPKGTIVNVTDSVGAGDDEWYFVDYKGQTGYMKAEYLTEATDEPTPEETEEEVEDENEEEEETAASAEEVSVETADTPIPEPTEDFVTINGKEYSTSLTGLDLSYPGLKQDDIVPLMYMTNLKVLKLFGDDITDLTPLSGLSNLSELTLWCRNVRDLTPLAGLTTLTMLRIVGAEIIDWSPVAHVPNIYRE